MNEFNLPKSIKSPFSQCDALLLDRLVKVTYKGIDLEIIEPYYKCEVTGVEFTTEESDALWYTEMIEKYEKINSTSLYNKIL